jgi:hypothetical protein
MPKTKTVFKKGRVFAVGKMKGQREILWKTEHYRLQYQS